MIDKRNEQQSLVWELVSNLVEDLRRKAVIADNASEHDVQLSVEYALFTNKLELQRRKENK